MKPVAVPMASLHGLEFVDMQRTYDDEARAVLVRFLQNAIDTIEKGHVDDPGDLGGIAKSLESIAVKFEEGGLLPDDVKAWFRSGYCLSELSSCLFAGIEHVLQDTDSPESDRKADITIALALKASKAIA